MSFRWNWLLGELERRFPNPQSHRSDRGPEVWYLEAIDAALAAAERAGAERAAELCDKALKSIPPRSAAAAEVFHLATQIRALFPPPGAEVGRG